MKILKRLLRITRIALLAILAIYAGAALVLVNLSDPAAAGNWLARNGFGAANLSAR